MNVNYSILKRTCTVYACECEDVDNAHIKTLLIPYFQTNIAARVQTESPIQRTNYCWTMRRPLLAPRPGRKCVVVVESPMRQQLRETVGRDEATKTGQIQK